VFVDKPPVMFEHLIEHEPNAGLANEPRQECSAGCRIFTLGIVTPPMPPKAKPANSELRA
jgi:hypothetical protein